MYSKVHSNMAFPDYWNPGIQSLQHSVIVPGMEPVGTL